MTSTDTIATIALTDNLWSAAISRRTTDGKGPTVILTLDTHGGSWLCRGCGALGRATDHIATRGEAHAHASICGLDNPPTVLINPVRALTLIGATGTRVVITDTTWTCQVCDDTGTTPHATLAGTVHAALCGSTDPDAVARYTMASHPALQAVVDAETTSAVADLQDRIVQLGDDLRDAQALTDAAIDERDEACRRYDQDVVADLRSDIRDLRSEAARADTKASILAAATGAGLVAGVHALSTGALSVPVLATGSAAGLAGVGVIGVLLTVLRPRVATDAHALVTRVIDVEALQVPAARERVQEPNLDGMATERRTMQRIVATKYGRIGHAITATGAAVVLALAAVVTAIITG